MGRKERCCGLRSHMGLPIIAMRYSQPHKKLAMTKHQCLLCPVVCRSSWGEGATRELGTMQAKLSVVSQRYEEQCGTLEVARAARGDWKASRFRAHTSLWIEGCRCMLCF